MLGRLAAVVALQAAALGVIVAGTVFVTRILHHDGLDAVPPLAVLVICTQVGLISGVGVAGVRALRGDRVDVAAGWLTGLIVVVVMPFAAALLASHGCRCC